MTKRSETRDFPGFMFYPSYADAFFSGALDDSQIAELLRTMVEFMRDPDFEPQLDPPLNMAFSFVRPNLEKALDDWRNGKKGGRPPKASAAQDKGNPALKGGFIGGKNPALNLDKGRLDKVSEELAAAAAPPAHMGGGGGPLREKGTCPSCGDALYSGHCFKCGVDVSGEAE